MTRTTLAKTPCGAEDHFTVVTGSGATLDGSWRFGLALPVMLCGSSTTTMSVSRRPRPPA
jgi:hypothetical protein